jgi:hypothetical protein
MRGKEGEESPTADVLNTHLSSFVFESFASFTARTRLTSFTFILTGLDILQTQYLYLYALGFAAFFKVFGATSRPSRYVFLD